MDYIALYGLPHFRLTLARSSARLFSTVILMLNFRSHFYRATAVVLPVLFLVEIGLGSAGCLSTKKSIGSETANFDDRHHQDREAAVSAFVASHRDNPALRFQLAELLSQRACRDTFYRLSIIQAYVQSGGTLEDMAEPLIDMLHIGNEQIYIEVLNYLAGTEKLGPAFQPIVPALVSGLKVEHHKVLLEILDKAETPLGDFIYGMEVFFGKSKQEQSSDAAINSVDALLLRKQVKVMQYDLFVHVLEVTVLGRLGSAGTAAVPALEQLQNDGCGFLMDQAICRALKSINPQYQFKTPAGETNQPAVHVPTEADPIYEAIGRAAKKLNAP